MVPSMLDLKLTPALIITPEIFTSTNEVTFKKGWVSTFSPLRLSQLWMHDLKP